MINNNFEIQDRVSKILSKQLSVNTDNIKPESLIGTDLGADSLDIAEIAMMIKDEFGYDLTEQDLSQAKSVKDIIDILSKNLSS